MHIWDTKGMQLTVEGGNAPAGDELISAEFSYGGGGTCQAGTVRPLGTYAQGRDTQWRFLLSGSPVFLGIPDNISDADGQLAQISLMAPHRPRLGGLGESLGGVQAEPHETLAAALERALGNSPAADIGIRPDGGEVTAVPWNGDAPELAGLAYSVRYIGPTYPDAVTDAVFDPGEGWKKYVYKRDTPPYALRRTAQAKADPAILSEEDRTVPVIRSADPVPPLVNGEVTHSYNNVIEADGVERTYAEVDSTATSILSDVGIFDFRIPHDTDERRHKRLRLRCPFFVSQIAPWSTPAPVRLVPISGGVSVTPAPAGSTVIIGNVSTEQSPPPPANLASGATLEQIASKVNEQNEYLATLRSRTNVSSDAISSAQADLARLAERVNQLGTYDISGNFENLAEEIKKTQDKVNEMGRAVTSLDAAARTPRNTPRQGELKLLITLLLVDAEGKEKPLSTAGHVFKEQDIGLEQAVRFDVDAPPGTAFKLRYELTEQDTGRSITMIFRPIEVAVDYDTPNVKGVQMPDGWDKPFSTAARYEFRLPGWHIPPFRAFGQQVASCTVTWNRDECSTLCTTGALGYD